MLIRSVDLETKALIQQSMEIKEKLMQFPSADHGKGIAMPGLN